MATLHCDASDCPSYADVLVSRIANGDTLAWCDQHFVQMCMAVADSMVQTEVDATDADALTRLGVQPEEPPTFPIPPESSDAGTAVPVPRSKRGNGSAKPDQTIPAD